MNCDTDTLHVWLATGPRRQKWLTDFVDIVRLVQNNDVLEFRICCSRPELCLVVRSLDSLCLPEDRKQVARTCTRVHNVDMSR